jgi:carbohydrate diacid regulator
LWCRPQGQASDDANLPARLAEAGFTVQRIAAGTPCDNLAALRRGYRQLRDLLAYGRDILPDTLRLDLAGLRLPSLLWRHRLEDGLEPWLLPLQGVIAHDANGQLLNTLRAWCEHDGQSQRCADALGIHRNSLRYRMERIAELSGLDPSTLEGMLKLYLGVRLWPCNDAQ